MQSSVDNLKSVSIPATISVLSFLLIVFTTSSKPKKSASPVISFILALSGKNSFSNFFFNPNSLSNISSMVKSKFSSVIGKSSISYLSGTI